MHICTSKIGKSCAGGYEYSYRIFNPNLFQNELYFPYRFTPESAYFADNEKGIEKGITQNTKEWFSYLKGEILEETIREFLYDLKPKDFFEAIKTPEILSKQSWSSLWLKAKRNNPELANYLLLIKQSEEALQYQLDEFGETNYTDSTTWQYDQSGKDALFDEYFPKLDVIKDKFIQERMAFLLLRRARYATNYLKVVELYTRYFKDKDTKSIIQAWADGHAAKAYWELDQQAYANLLLVRSFYKADDRKLRAYIGFDNNFYESTLALAKNNEEKAWVITLAALKNPNQGLNALNEILQISPNSEALDVLLLREIEKTDNYIVANEVGFPYAYYGYAFYPFDYNAEKELTEIEKQNLGKNYLNTVLAFINQALETNKLANPTTFKLVKAYLEILTKNYSQAEYELSLLEKSSLQAAYKRQCTELQLLLAISRATKVDSPLLSEIYSYLPTLMAKKTEVEYQELGNSNLFYYLANEFKRLGYLHYAAAFIGVYHENDGYAVKNYLDLNATPNDLENYLKMLQAPSNDFERFLSEKSGYSVNECRELLAMKYLRTNNLEKSKYNFELIAKDGIGENESTYLIYNPEIANYNGFYRYYLEKGKLSKRDKKINLGVALQKNTRLGYLTKMLAFKELLASNPNNFEACYRLANMYFNTSYYGNSWYMQSYYQGYYPNYGSMPENYFTNLEAEQLYKKALSISPNKEKSAEITLLLARCEYNRIAYRANNPYAYQAKLNSEYATNTYLIAFNSNYSQTKYYKQLISICGSDYFNFYLSGNQTN